MKSDQSVVFVCSCSLPAVLYIYNDQVLASMYCKYRRHFLASSQGVPRRIHVDSVTISTTELYDGYATSTLFEESEMWNGSRRLRLQPRLSHSVRSQTGIMKSRHTRESLWLIFVHVV